MEKLSNISLNAVQNGQRDINILVTLQQHVTSLMERLQDLISFSDFIDHVRGHEVEHSITQTHDRENEMDL